MPATLPTDELAAWIRLTLEPGLGPAQARTLLAALGLPHHIFAMSSGSLAKFIPRELATQLHNEPSADITVTIDKTLQWAAQPQHHIVTLADPAYPPALLDIHDPPLLLYVNGQIDMLSRPVLSVVGSRSATPQGSDNAAAFAQYLAEHGWCIASGLAAGIDTAAHQGALRAGNKSGGTIAILGTGIDVVYPSANRELAHRIADQGALVSEFPLGTRAIAYQFPKRNRIVAGLARGVLVVEAAKQSGSLITAKLASEMGREVFAIPGSIHSPMSRGCHALIRQGAKLVESGQDIHDELGLPSLNFAPALKPSRQSARGPSTSTGTTPPPTGPAPSPKYAALLSALGFDPVDLDTLLARTSFDLATLSTQLLELQLMDMVSKLDDGRFQRR